jgi:lysophospholipase L1-like esterase
MRRISLYPALLLILLIAGCSGDQDSLAPIPADGTILAFGDSLTYGTGVSRDESYPSVLQQLTGRKVINAGVPGEVTAEGVRRLTDLLGKHSPDLLILIHGGNDMLRKKSIDMATNNLRTMILMAQESNVQVIMLAVPNPTLILSPAEFYEELANNMRVPIEVDAISDILQYPGNKSDAIHPNAAGYRMMAESIYELLLSRGAL